MDLKTVGPFVSAFQHIAIPANAKCCESVPEFYKWVNEVAKFCTYFGLSLTMVKADMEQNLKKLEKAAKKHNATEIEVLLRAEQATGDDRHDDSGTVGVLWLQRGVQFLIEFFIAILTQPTEETRSLMQIAYERSLKPHHNWLLQKTFAAISYTFPLRAAFIKSLSCGKASEQQVLHEMGSFLLAYQEPMDKLRMKLIALGIEIARTDLGEPVDFTPFIPPPQLSVLPVRNRISS